jgi:hypothetical protein
MSLENFAHFNDLSPELRLELEQKVESFGKRVRYKFDVAKPNPDPEKYNGAFVYPNMYTLDPTKFTIQDPYEKRADKSKTKNIGLVDDNFLSDNGIPERFKKVRISGSQKSILTLNLEDNRDDFYMAMMLELHPKNKDSKFASKTLRHMILRIDENAAAREARTERSERLKALNVAQGMSDGELIDFADAMQWDSSDEIEILRNRTEELADSNPVYFNDFVQGKTIEYQSMVKQAINKGLISFDNTEYKFVWSGNQQTIAVLSPTGEKSNIEKMSEWMQTSGNKGDDFYKKIKALVRGIKKTSE